MVKTIISLDWTLMIHLLSCPYVCYLHLHSSIPYTTTSTSTEAPIEPPVGPQWPPPPGPWACGPDTSDPATTCTLCGANPWDLNHDIPGWGGLCPYCVYTIQNLPG